MPHVLAIGLDRRTCAAIAAALGVDEHTLEVETTDASRAVVERAASATAVILGDEVADPLATAHELHQAAPGLPILLVQEAGAYAPAHARRRAEPPIPPPEDPAAPAPTMAKLQDAVRDRDEFFSLASHELKTPLTPLKLQVQILARKAGQVARDAEAQGWLEQRLAIIHRQVDRLTTLVSDLLDVSRIAGARLPVSPAPTDLAAVTRAVIDRMRAEGELERAGVTIALRAPTVAVGVWDPARLEQVVKNLLQNALKCGPDHTIAVEISLREDRAELRIDDDGAAASQTGERRLLDRIERTAPDGAPHRGFGVGLYIARAVAELLGGRIVAEAPADAETTFVLTLPL